MGCDNDGPEKVEKWRRRDTSAASGALIVFKTFCSFLGFVVRGIFVLFVPWPTFENDSCISRIE